MCGITGIFDTRGQRSVDRAVLERMNTSQAHRGPDGEGTHVEPGVGLGHRRLSIIDLATGQQPIYNEDGSVVVVFNGEIYNYQALIPELVALGHVFRTRSDTEVIVHAWEAWGERVRRALPRHVRLRAVGPQARDAVPGARPPRREAALLRGPAGRHAALRLGAEVAARPRRARPHDRSVRDRGVFRAGLRRRTTHGVRGCAQAAAGPHVDDPPWRAGARTGRLLGSRASRSIAC